MHLLRHLLLLSSAPTLATGFRVLVDLNAFSPDELDRVPADFPRADGAWTLTHNTHPSVSDAAWKAAINHLARGGLPALTVSEDDPMQFQECSAVARILGAPPMLAFGYHETGGQPATQLNSTEIDLYHSKCGTDVAILTRAYWPSSPWRTRVEAVLHHPHLGSVAMEYSPDNYGLRSEQTFVKEVLAAGRKAIFLWPVAPNNRSLETNIFDAITSFTQACGNHTPPTSPCGPLKDPTGHGCACGMDMGSDDVWVVIARYGLPHGAACGAGSACIFGPTNSMAAAVKEALRLQATLRLKTDDIQLEFGPPVTMPVFCPTAKCRFGGSVGADTFFGFGGSSLGNVLGSVNRSVVWSSDSGVSWTVLPGEVAKEGLAQSAIGPGIAFQSGVGVETIGGATLNHTLHPLLATGNRVSQWNVTSVTPSPSAGWWRAPERPHWAIKRTVVTGNLSWLLPFDDICVFSDYSAAPVEIGSNTWLKTVVIKTNCSKPPTGWGDAGAAGNIHIFQSTDLQTWRWRSLVAAGNATQGAEEGANENAIARLDDGSLLVVFRRDGGDGWPSHSHKSFMAVRSRDNGMSWSTPEALPPHVLSARPQLLKIDNGPLFLTGGRPHLMLWVSADGSGRSWSESHNLAGEHNRRQPDASLRFCDAFANGTSTWLESTCYNSLVQVAEDPHSGRKRLLVCYDRMGTEAPVAPKECQPKRVDTFCMQITVAPASARQ